MDRKLYERHREGLHSLLCSEGLKASGLPAHDIGRALGLSPEETTDLLVVAQHESAVRLDSAHDPELWVSTSRLGPGPAATAPDTRTAIGAAVPWVVGPVAAILLAVGAYWAVPSPEAPRERKRVAPAEAAIPVSPKNLPRGSSAATFGGEAIAPARKPAVFRPTQPRSRTERVGERAAALVAKEEAERLRDEAEALNERLAAWQESAAKNGCQARWKAAESCYIGGRLLSRIQHEREAADLKLRSLEIAGLLERYSGPPPRSE